MDQSDIEYDREKTISAWRQFIETGTIPDFQVRRPVADSWIRCRELGVDPFGATYPHLSRHILNKVQNEQRELLTCAIPCMRLLHIAAGSGGVAISTPDMFTYYMISEYESDPLSYGIYLEERTCGNTAISISYHERAAAFLHKYEKYRVVDQSFSAAAAPIWIDGEIAGFLSMSGTSSLSPDQAVLLSEAGAAAVSALRTGGFSSDRFLDTASSLINMGHRPIMVIDPDGMIVAANNDCGRFLSVRDSGGAPVRLSASLVNRDDINLFTVNEERQPGRSCDVRTIYGNIFNCEILTKDTVRFPDGQSCTAVSLGITPPGRQVRAKSRTVTPVQSVRSEKVEYVGESIAWSKIDHVVRKVARFPSNVFIQGESGTGKEVVARTIHALSGRSGEFVAINCGDIPESLLQSELFGYEKGSFTGANREGSMGKFEYANRGTVFLDEIGDMPLSMQVSLLRFIQERTVQRIGSNRPKPVDVRIIAATNKNIEQLLKEQLFRVDLFYRLSIIGITLPPLRERREDVPVLAQYFLKGISKQYGMPEPIVDDDVYGILSRCDWPGNVRELRNAVEKLLIMNDHGHITADTVYTYVFDYDSFNSTSSTLPRLDEKSEIVRLLREQRGNITKTAAALGVARDTLYRKMKKYGITSDK